MEEEYEEKERCKKVSFINEDFAIQYLKKLKETSTRTKVPSRAYLCETCLNWHLTSKGDYNEDVKPTKTPKAKLDNQLRDRDGRIKKLEKSLAKAYDRILELNRSNDNLRKMLLPKQNEKPNDVNNL